MVNRRKFLKVGAIAATAGVTGGVSLNASAAKDLKIRGNKDYSPTTGRERKMIPSACWQCVTRCANVGYVEDGRLVKIEPQMNSIRTGWIVSLA